MHQVRFTKPYASIKHQRIESDRATFADATCSGVGQFVRLANNKAVKCETGVQRSSAQVLAGFAFRLIKVDVQWLGCARRTLRAVGSCLKQHTLDRYASRVQFIQDQVGKILSDIVAHKVRRHVKNGDAFVELREFQGFNPGGVIVLSHRLEQLLSELSPFFFCHSAPHASRVLGPMARFCF